MPYETLPKARRKRETWRRKLAVGRSSITLASISKLLVTTLEIEIGAPKYEADEIDERVKLGEYQTPNQWVDEL